MNNNDESKNSLASGSISNFLHSSLQESLGMPVLDV
jgi:hypothetical protein